MTRNHSAKVKAEGNTDTENKCTRCRKTLVPEPLLLCLDCRDEAVANAQNISKSIGFAALELAIYGAKNGDVSAKRYAAMPDVGGEPLRWSTRSNPAAPLEHPSDELPDAVLYRVEHAIRDLSGMDHYPHTDPTRSADFIEDNIVGLATHPDAAALAQALSATARTLAKAYANQLLVTTPTGMVCDQWNYDGTAKCEGALFKRHIPGQGVAVYDCRRCGTTFDEDQYAQLRDALIRESNHLLTSLQAATLVNRKQQSVHRAAKNGQIDAVNTPKGLRVHLDSLIRWDDRLRLLEDRRAMREALAAS